MPGKIEVARTTDIPLGEGRSFKVGKRVVAIFNVDGEFFAINDACPHMGASLSVGDVEDGIVTCPLHAWRFDVRDGTWRDNPRVKTDHWPLEVDGDRLLITLE